MQTKQKFKLLGIVTMVLGVVAVISAATFYDLTISNALYNPTSAFGKWFSAWGELPAFLPLPFVFGVWLVCLAKQKRASVVVLMVMCAASVVATWFLVLEKFVFEPFMQPIWWVTLLVSLCVSFATVLGLWFVPLVHLKKLSGFGVWLLLLILITALFTQGIKLVWGRVRFRNLEDISQFTSWYLPQGVNGNKSFVSGHTSAATALFGLQFLPQFYQKTKRLTVWFWLGSVLWVGFVALSRMVQGAHYLSDVLFGALLGFAVLTVLLKVRKKMVKKQNG